MTSRRMEGQKCVAARSDRTDFGHALTTRDFISANPMSNLRWVCLISLLCVSSLLRAADVRIEAHSMDQKYCREENGLEVLRLSITTRFTNVSDRTLILPKLFRGTEYVITTGRKQAKSSIELDNLGGIGENVWMTPTPSAEWFDVVRPGQSVLRPPFRISVRLTELSGNRQDRTTITATLNLGPAGFYPLDKYAASWQEIGTLITGPVQTDAMKLDVSPPSTLPKCPGWAELGRL